LVLAEDFRGFSTGRL